MDTPRGRSQRHQEKQRGLRAIAAARRHFTALRDTRLRRGKRHALVDVVLISLLAVLCGSDSADDIAEWAELHEDWLEQWFELPHGTPSQDTILRVLETLNPKTFHKAVQSWLRSLRPSAPGQIAIDGKALRGSASAAHGSKAVYLVSAWMGEAGLVLGQQKTRDKSNETMAIPELLDLIDVGGCLVSVDAAGCYRPIAEQIVSQNGSYLLSVKGNQPTLREDIERLFAEALDARRRSRDELGRPDVECATGADSGHGRIEERTAYLSRDLSWLTTAEQWHGIAAVGMVQAQRTRSSTGEVQSERRYYITSDASMSAESFL